MKLRRNDLQQLRKDGLKAIEAKLIELTQAQIQARKDALGQSAKNPKASRILRRSLAQLKTLATSLKENL